MRLELQEEEDRGEAAEDEVVPGPAGGVHGAAAGVQTGRGHLASRCHIVIHTQKITPSAMHTLIIHFCGCEVKKLTGDETLKVEYI